MPRGRSGSTSDEIRRRNLIPPKQVALHDADHWVYDSGEFAG